jgi:hypothetical protein
MDNRDHNFFEEFKPLHVPHKYDQSASTQDNVIFALAQLKEASAEEVASKLDSLESDTDHLMHQKNAEDVLSYLFNKGLIKAINKNGELNYNLSKIEAPNSGKIDKPFL